jgi:hypothetical protein
MDGRAFDQLTRSLRQRLYRRQALGGALAGIVAVVGLAGEADARPSRTCRPLGAGCTRNSQCCGNLCNTLRTAPRNQRNRCACMPDCEGKVCGDDGCGGTCGAGTCGDYQVCDEGDCVPAIDCSTYEAYPTSLYVGLCADTTEGGAVEIFRCNDGFTGHACETTDDCADVANSNPGSVVVCSAGGVICYPDQGGFCKEWSPGGSFCIVGAAASVSCPG